MANPTYTFDKTAKGYKIESSDGLYRKVGNSGAVIDFVENATKLVVHTVSHKEDLTLKISEFGSINGSPPPSTLLLIQDALLNTVFI